MLSALAALGRLTLLVSYVFWLADDPYLASGVGRGDRRAAGPFDT